ncbi:MAG: DUF6922 domain-containing protein [bacterium]
MKLKYFRHNNPKKIFNPILFWDAQHVDYVKNADYVIVRILDCGDGNDIKRLKKIYPAEKIIEVFKKRRGLMAKTGKFWAIYFGIPLEEIACLKRY